MIASGVLNVGRPGGVGLRVGGGRVGRLGKELGTTVTDEEEDVCLLRRVNDGREKDLRCLDRTVGNGKVFGANGGGGLVIASLSLGCGVAFEA